VLPLERALGTGRSGGPADGGAIPAAVPARGGSAGGRDGSVPAAARRNRIVMSPSAAPTALGDQRSTAGDPPAGH
jgi:hypothetical protein